MTSASAAAQAVDSLRANAEGSANAASPFLPADHWAVIAARRMDALGLGPKTFAFGDGSLTRFAAGRMLRDASVRPKAERPGAEPVARMYWERFAREFPATAAALGRTEERLSTPIEGFATAGFERKTGRLFPVRTTNGRSFEGPFPRRDLGKPVAAVNAALLAGRRLALSLGAEYSGGRLTAGDSHAVFALGKVGAWAGRRSPAFGPGERGGLLFSGAAPLAGGGVALIEPVSLPWILKYAGAIRFEALLARLDSNAAITHPWIVASHASLAPHPRLLVGLTQSFMFGGEGLPPLTLENFLSLYAGKRLENNDSSSLANFENGLISGELRFRPPLPGIPVILYLEIGAEDTHADLTAHAPWRVVPARMLGILFPSVGPAASLSVGLEHTYFSGPCSGCSYYATWYRHYLFKDGWTVDREPIGHPLGGDGTEWLLHGTWDDASGRFRIRGRAFRRTRGPYNLYSPALEGSSIGGRLTGMYQVGPQVRVLFDGLLESPGRGERQTSLAAGAKLLF